MSSPSPAPPPPPRYGLPATADGYTIDRLLGRGSFGAVVKATVRWSDGESPSDSPSPSESDSRHPLAPQVVAIKVVSPQRTGADEMALIGREIEVLSDLAGTDPHPNIVNYYGSFFVGRNLWIVMELCDGGSVADLLSYSAPILSEEVGSRSRSTTRPDLDLDLDPDLHTHLDLDPDLHTLRERERERSTHTHTRTHTRTAYTHIDIEKHTRGQVTPTPTPTPGHPNSNSNSHPLRICYLE